MKVVKKANNTIEIEDVVREKRYVGAAVYKAYSEDGRTVILKAGNDDCLPTFNEIPENIENENGVNYGDLSQTLEALNAFVGSFRSAASTGGSTGGGVSPSIVPAQGEVFFGDDDFRQMNYVSAYESEANSIGVGTFAFKPIVSAKLNSLTTISNTLFKGSNYTYGSFNEATTIDNGAFAETQIHYINKQRAKAEHNTLLPKVTAIKSHAFADCKSLIEAYFPKVVKVEKFAFQNCTNLTKLQLSDCISFDFSAITNCVSLKEFDLYGFEIISDNPDNRIIGCANLKNVVMPDITEVKGKANNLFFACAALETISMRKLKVVPPYFLANKRNLKYVNMNSVETIDNGAFENCVNLFSLDADKVSIIGEYAFNNCVNLGSIDVSNVTQIGRKALANMDNLISLTFGKNIEYWFYSTLEGSVCNCYGLIEVNVPDNWRIPATGISFPGCPNISEDSVVSMFNKLASNVSKPIANIAFNKSVLDRLSSDEKNVAINKNYNLVELN